MKQFMIALILLAAFVTNAVAKAEDLQRGDLNAAAEQARLEQVQAKRAMDAKESQVETAPESVTTANLE